MSEFSFFGRLTRPVPRYLITASICASLHIAVMIGADSLGAHYLVCQIASAAVLLPVGYWLTSGYVFKAQRGIREFIRYSLAVLTNFPMQLLFVWLTKGLLNLPMTLVAPASVLFLGAWNYASSYWALSRSTGAEK